MEGFQMEEIPNSSSTHPPRAIEESNNERNSIANNNSEKCNGSTASMSSIILNTTGLNNFYVFLMMCLMSILSFVFVCIMIGISFRQGKEYGSWITILLTIIAIWIPTPIYSPRKSNLNSVNNNSIIRSNNENL
ncbi:hypothetical protein ACTFIZ_010229 [Dictyostelium cf. discoideum]